jgi:hypothetical protein
MHLLIALVFVAIMSLPLLLGTTIIAPQTSSILAGPRGIGARAAGGAYTQDCQQDLLDADPFQGPPTYISGSTDAIVPSANVGGGHAGGNYVIKTAGVDAITMPTPIVGLDDNLTVAIYSDTANAHTITAATACIANGVATLKTVINLSSFRGAGVTLRAMNGTWQVVGQTGVSSFA